MILRSGFYQMMKENAGQMAGKVWKLGHAEKNNWDMGTLSRMIASFNKSF